LTSQLVKSYGREIYPDNIDEFIDKSFRVLSNYKIKVKVGIVEHLRAEADDYGLLYLAKVFERLNKILKKKECS
jgi:hypothetical protein